jgi:hypothetical protein
VGGSVLQSKARVLHVIPKFIAFEKWKGFEILDLNYQLPSFWIKALQLCLACLVVGTAHVAGYVLMFPNSIVPMLNLGNIGSQFFDVGVSGSFAVLTFHLAETVARTLLAFMSFLVAKFFVRPNLIIHAPQKGRLMRMQEARNNKILEKHGFMLSTVSSAIVFALVHLGFIGTFRWLYFCGLVLLFVPMAYRGKKFPSAFLTAKFWIENRAGRKLFVGLLIAFSALLGVERHKAVREVSNLKVEVNGGSKALALVGVTAIGPVLYEAETREYYVKFGDDFNRILK